MTPSVQVTDIDLYMIYVEEKVKKNTHKCMCITYRISFVCGLTNPSEKERINNTQCAQYVSTKLPILEVVLVQSQYCKNVNNVKSKPGTLELCITATILIRS